MSDRNHHPLIKKSCPFWFISIREQLLLNNPSFGSLDFVTSSQSAAHFWRAIVSHGNMCIEKRSTRCARCVELTIRRIVLSFAFPINRHFWWKREEKSMGGAEVCRALSACCVSSFFFDYTELCVNDLRDGLNILRFNSIMWCWLSGCFGSISNFNVIWIAYLDIFFKYTEIFALSYRVLIDNWLSN